MSIKKIYLEVTDRCNLNCKICYRRAWSSEFYDMDISLLKKIYKEIKDDGDVEEIVIGGIGEPTCHPYIEDIIKLFREYKILLTTNGTQINKQIAECIVKYVSEVTISIDGLEENLNNIRGISLNNIIKNIELINSLKKAYGVTTCLLNIQFVLTKDNKEDLIKVIDLASDLKAKFVVISNVIPQSREMVDKILYTRYENKEIRDLFNKAIIQSMHRGIKLKLPNYELKTERQCSFINNDSIYISASGDIVPCYRFSHDSIEYIFGVEKTVNKFSYGNVKEEKILDIWNNKEYVQFREEIYNNHYPSCLDCDTRDACDFIKNSDVDCYGIKPFCSDCLWSRKFVQCP